MGKIKCPAWSCRGGIVVGPYDHEWTCKACDGTGLIEGEEKPPEFEPAFDMPTTKEQALQCLEKWGNPTCATFNAARAKRMWELLSEPTPAVTANKPPLTGRWHHGNGVIVSGSIRIARWDCDTCPPEEFRDEVLDWICETLNAGIAATKGGE